MPDIFGSNYKRFLEWMLASGKAEHGLGDVFLATVVDAINTVKAFQEQEVARSPVLATDNKFVDGPVSGRPADGAKALRLTRMALAIYESRPELQRYFPDPCGRESAPFLVWLLTYGKKEHDLTAFHLAPLKAQWRSVVNAQPTVLRRLRYEVTLRAFAASVYAQTALRRVSLLGRRRLRVGNSSVRPRKHDSAQQHATTCVRRKLGRLFRVGDWRGSVGSIRVRSAPGRGDSRLTPCHSRSASVSHRDSCAEPITQVPTPTTCSMSTPTRPKS